MGKCNAKFILNDCQCLADPFDVYTTVCSYVSKVDGQAYPCDPGCCEPKCDNTDPDMSRMEVRPSSGTKPAAVFGLDLPVTEHFGQGATFPIWMTIVILVLVFIGLKIGLSLKS